MEHSRPVVGPEPGAQPCFEESGICLEQEGGVTKQRFISAEARPRMLARDHPSERVGPILKGLPKGKGSADPMSPASDLSAYSAFQESNFCGG
ncbi:hypothetical protein NDU88_000479 [Pleurodeles waltl]|uniref:Uncharacterized protein n=1 Tax=Pleurodeles waltl TaxID=8319 RepID=A0AAV7L9X6_PLEWA|nr:hypothetical protein NDU88_000479 [Pleurodeles waltl]